MPIYMIILAVLGIGSGVTGILLGFIALWLDSSPSRKLAFLCMVGVFMLLVIVMLSVGGSSA